MKHIGLTCSYPEWPRDADDERRLMGYLNAIKDAGGQGEPLWIPAEGDLPALAGQVASRLDGLVICGGADLPPHLYGEEPRGDANLDTVTPARPNWESFVVPAFLERDKPILGICYGCQFINVWRGGTLIQDIPSEWPNPIQHGGDVLHIVRLEPGSKLARIVGEEEIEIDSYHHQAIARVAQDGIVTAWAPDNTPEALEFTDEAWMLGVQWHPERTPNSNATRRIFEALLRGKDKPLH